jgi:hypothetical protein
MKTYAYCLTESIEVLPAAVRGIAGAEVRLFNTEEFSVFVSDFSGNVVPFNRNDALIHAAVVRSVLDQTTPLPCRFGTVVTEEELLKYLTVRRDALLAKLAKIHDCVEMNVRIISDQNRTEEVEVQVAENPGTSFLLQKRREILRSEARAAEAKKLAAWLQGLVGEFVRQTEIKTNTTNALILTEAHLVERDLVERYRETLKQVRRERPELKFLVSGPWAPYTFANIDLEFRRQFGVS